MKLPFFNKPIKNEAPTPTNDASLWNMKFPDVVQKKLLEEALISNVFTGFSYLMPNPNTELRKMGKDIEAYREIASDPQLKGVIESNRKAGVTSLVQYMDNPKCPKQELEFFQKFFQNLTDEGNFTKITNQTLDAPQYGRVMFGLVWQVVDNYFIPVRIEQMPHEHCKYDYNGNLLVSKDGSWFEPPVHPAKYIVLRNKPTLENPYGDPLLSSCFWNVRFKKDGMKLWAQFSEKFGMPWVYGKYSPNVLASSFGTDVASAANLLLQQLSMMARDGIIVAPDGVEINVINDGQKGAIDVFERLIRICDEQNTKLQLGHSGATESTSGDKLSNDTTATEVRQAVVDSDKEFPIMFWNKIITWIHRFNFSGTERPVFNLYSQEDVDMAQAQRDAILVPVLQLSGKKYSGAYLEKTYGYEKGDLEDVELNTTSSAGSTKTNQSNTEATSQQRISEFLNKATINKSNTQETYPDQELIDERADEESGDTEAFDKLIDVVVNYINNKDDYSEALKDLAKVFPDMNTGELEDKLTNILFVADIVGRLSVQAETNELKAAR